MPLLCPASGYAFAVICVVELSLAKGEHAWVLAPWYVCVLRLAGIAHTITRHLGRIPDSCGWQAYLGVILCHESILLVV